MLTVSASDGTNRCDGTASSQSHFSEILGCIELHIEHFRSTFTTKIAPLQTSLVTVGCSFDATKWSLCAGYSNSTQANCHAQQFPTLTCLRFGSPAWQHHAEERRAPQQGMACSGGKSETPLRRLGFLSMGSCQCSLRSRTILRYMQQDVLDIEELDSLYAHLCSFSRSKSLNVYMASMSCGAGTRQLRASKRGFACRAAVCRSHLASPDHTCKMGMLSKVYTLSAVDG